VPLLGRTGSTYQQARDEEVLLVFPGKYGALNPVTPLSIVYLAKPLLDRGYKVRLFDMRTENYEELRVGHPLCIGISCMTGSQISYGLQFASSIRRLIPFIPIIWGGVHPTLLPEQTISDERVDIVVRGEGERTFVELLDNLESKRTLENVKGITYKYGGSIKNNPDREFVDLDTTSFELPYELLKLERYRSFQGGHFYIQTSRGCPHMCSFCYNLQFSNCRWRYKNARRVVDEIQYVLTRFEHVNFISFIDDNFFVSRKRVEDICRDIIQRQLNIQWNASCRFDYLARYDKAFIELLEKSGCVQLDFGGESGSDRILRLINKDVIAEQMIKAMENLGRWGSKISPAVTWMGGLPTETEKEFEETCELMDALLRVNSKVHHVDVFMYTPYPGSLLECLTRHTYYTPPKSFEEWGKIDSFHFRPPWLSQEFMDLLETVAFVVRFAFYSKACIKERLGLPYRIGYGILSFIAKLRWRYKFFRFQIEVKLVNIWTKKVRGFV
jgi:radical SAM superfamily enzyme YgiQ (UPF0313 family)